LFKLSALFCFCSGRHVFICINFKEILTIENVIANLSTLLACLSLSPNTAVVTIALTTIFTMNLRSYEEISIILKNLSKHSDKFKIDARGPIENLERSLDDISKVVAEAPPNDSSIVDDVARKSVDCSQASCGVEDLQKQMR
jgi:hypothetical protein